MISSKSHEKTEATDEFPLSAVCAAAVYHIQLHCHHKHTQHNIKLDFV